MTWVTGANAALLTDFYELTMAASYHANRIEGNATFDLFIRHLPERRNFLIACGLEQALEYLEGLAFNDEAIGYLDSLNRFSDDFLAYLENLRFTGEVWAAREGEVVFAEEPILRVTAPIIEAQIVETFLLNCVTFQTMVASKAARVALACGERRFVDFSPRRDHGADAALKAARAAYVGGAFATSNVLAGSAYDIPVSGTMAHSYVMAFEDETEAFRAFVRDFPDRAVLLIDTFDVEEGARRAVRVFKELESTDVELRGVRIDSGDLAPLTRSVRKILDEAGLQAVEIMLSGDLDEYRIKELLDDGAPVDAFGVGTQLGTSGDAPTLGSVYKLVADARGPKIKLSTGKATLPGCKQVYRFERDGIFDHDVIALEIEEMSGGRPLLHRAMRDGHSVEEPESLSALTQRCRTSLDKLPSRLKSLDQSKEPYAVGRSDQLRELVRQIGMSQR
jgi:nicotinate phosphoribosyltransferase